MSTNALQTNQKSIESIIQNLKQQTQNLTQLLEKTTNTDQKKPMEPAEKENLKKNIYGLQKEINDLTKQLNLTIVNQKPQTQQNTNPPTQQTQKLQTPNNKASNLQNRIPQKLLTNQPQQKPHPNNSIIIKNWEDYEITATNPQVTIFKLEEAQNTFKAKTQKNNFIYSFTGQTPKTSNLLKNWLSQQLGIPKERIYEGTIKAK